MLKTFLVVAATGIVATWAMAAPIDIPSASTDQTMKFALRDGGGDAMSMVRQRVRLALDSSSTVTGTLVSGISTQRTFWTIMQGPGIFVVDAGSPTDFSARMGEWRVTRDGLTFNKEAAMGTGGFTVNPDFQAQSVPEPGTFGLIGTALAGLFLMRRKRTAPS